MTLALFPTSDPDLALCVVAGNQMIDRSLFLEVRQLRQLLDDLLPEFVAFTDNSTPETEALIRSMKDTARNEGLDALAIGLTPIEALKSVRETSVIASVDRHAVREIGCPELIRRTALTEALNSIDDRSVNPTALIAETGGKIDLIDPPPRR